MISYDFTPLLLCNIALRVFHDILSLSFSLVLHNVACIAIARLCSIKMTGYRITNENVWKWVTFTTIYVFSTWLIIEIDYYNNGFWTYNGITCRMLGKCEQAADIVNQESHSLAIFVIAVWMSSCNVTIWACTLYSLFYIRKESRRFDQHLSGQNDKINTKRIKTIVGLTAFVILSWIPYGVTAGEYESMGNVVYAYMNLYFALASYASFIVVPGTYYFMDRRSESYVKNVLRKRGRIEPQQAADNVNRRTLNKQRNQGSSGTKLREQEQKPQEGCSLETL